MSKPKTANQYLASIGIGPVNPVCGRCGRETGRIYTADKLCVDCLIKQGQIIPQRPRKQAKPVYKLEYNGRDDSYWIVAEFPDGRKDYQMRIDCGRAHREIAEQALEQWCANSR